ncbi:MAG: precorrin-2 C(20)-methyltransferase [Proteobacteria bacterium]|nr:precorrin-2 C(20)-methyltransferase [Pseudomonadota bacterium]
MNKEGVFYAVGVGPGDPELVTRKAWRVVAESPVVAYPTTNADAKGEGHSIARGIVADAIAKTAIEVPIALPIGLPVGEREAVYKATAAVLMAHIKAGRDVAVLCEGDPLFYGSVIPLLSALPRQTTTEIIPAISAPHAAAAVAGLPLTQGKGRMLVMPAVLADEELVASISAHTKAGDAVAVIKLGGHGGRVKRLLAGLRLSAHATYIAHATLASQVICPVAAMPDHAPYFSLILIVPRHDKTA